MDPFHSINELPSVKLILQAHGEEGVLHICSYYGCTDHEMDLEMKEGEVTHFVCPHCESDLKSAHLCRECHSPMDPFDMERGGRLYMCARKGCNMHFLNFKGLRPEDYLLTIKYRS